MSSPAVAALEAALRTCKLDRTLVSARPSLGHTDAPAVIPTGVAALDATLRGGLPRGQLSEIDGPRSSGRTTLLLHLIATAIDRGEIAALVDTLDRFDVASANAAGVDLDRLLWVRGHAITTSDDSSRSPQALLDRSIDRALKALNLVLHAGGFGVVALDLADVPAVALKRIPFTTWLRVQRTIEGSDTACVLLTPEPLARSAGGITVSLDAVVKWAGNSDRSRHVAGLDMMTRVMSPRQRVQGNVRFVATASHFDTPGHRGTEDISGSFSVAPCLGVSSLSL
jgi:recA bacterial DNA recombination protein